jgi:pseudouridine-5'-phosphate glycosidase
MAGDVIDQLIAEALAEVRAQGLTGRAVTPALLQWLAVSSRGGTLQANTALIRHNCAVAGQVALALSELNSL